MLCMCVVLCCVRVYVMFCACMHARARVFMYTYMRDFVCSYMFLSLRGYYGTHFLYYFSVFFFSFVFVFHPDGKESNRSRTLMF